ncbi:hypothetical protein [Candidatus Magnetomonas plexicatena]|uniref:hypothetical protein n=1 Tax=Candidatus Magnetomonas plexicatena TaxID=2552947 RepID=UPI00110419B1|nr:SprT family zinc-dependent metalloprotease [Nitrospirales bacterium LBB_01]
MYDSGAGNADGFDRLKRCIEKAVGISTNLTITDNSSSLLTITTKDKTLVVRAHKMFLTAPFGVMKEIANIASNKKTKNSVIKKYIKDNADSIKTPPINRKRTVITQGKFHDLREMFDAVNSTYFGGSISCVITWARRSSMGFAKRRRLGAYNSELGIITINPVLDKPLIPRYIVEYIIYHEMLHIGVGVRRGKNKRSVHFREFKELERQFKDYEAVVSFIKGNFDLFH